MALGTASSQRIFADPADALLADVACSSKLRCEGGHRNASWRAVKIDCT